MTIKQCHTQIVTEREIFENVNRILSFGTSCKVKHQKLESHIKCTFVCCKVNVHVQDVFNQKSEVNYNTRFKTQSIPIFLRFFIRCIFFNHMYAKHVQGSCLGNQRTTSERDGDIKDHMENATIVRLNVCFGFSFNNSAKRDVLLHHTIHRVCT